MPEATIITLPSGKTATIRPGKGKDLLDAQRIAKHPEEIIWALTAQLVTIDGQAHVMEDYLEMDLLDVAKLQEVIQSGNARTQAPNT